MITWFIKKYVLNLINNILDDVKDNQKILYWKNKIKSVITYLQNLLAYIEDYKIDVEEADKIAEEAKKLFD